MMEKPLPRDNGLRTSRPVAGSDRIRHCAQAPIAVHSRSSLSPANGTGLCQPGAPPSWADCAPAERKNPVTVRILGPDGYRLLLTGMWAVVRDPRCGGAATMGGAW